MHAPDDAEPPLTSPTKPAGARPAPDKLTGKVTSKLQVTIPKALATQLGIRPGDRLEWEMLGRALQLVPMRAGRPLREQERWNRWTQMVERAAARRLPAPKAPGGRGWTRAELYERSREKPR